MKRSILTFLTPTDEVVLSTLLLRNVPDVTFVDGCYWSSPEPPIKETIAACADSMVLLWDPSIAPRLPFIQRKSGGYQGPQSGIVIQLLRSRLKANFLYAGNLSVGWDSAPMSDFVKLVFASLNAVTSPRLVAVDPTTNAVRNSKVQGFRVGYHAVAWCHEEPGRFFRDQTVHNHYKPHFSVPCHDA